jgi:gamma-glutamyltranspeptidase/glutathione hydrolase
MRVVMFQALGLSAAIVASSSAYAVTLEGGAVAAQGRHRRPERVRTGGLPRAR